MRIVRVASLVEGDGEVQAVPVLLRRIIAAIEMSCQLEIPPSFRHPRSSLKKPGGLEAAIDAVALKFPGHAVLVLADSDDDCPAALGSELQARARVSRPDLAVSIVLAHCEFETWFLAGAESLAGKRDLAPTLASPADFEEIRNAKGWLTERMAGSRRYRETQDQAALTAVLDLDLVLQRSRSFRKLWKELQAMTGASPFSGDAAP